MPKRRSALEDVLLKGGRDGASGSRACRIGEIRGWSLLQVAGFKSTMREVETIIASHLSGEVPARIGKTTNAGRSRLLRTGPEQVWILSDDVDDPATRLGPAISEDIGALTSLSHSRTRLFIEGSPARDVLAKGIPIDLHPDAFAVGDFALTGLHHTPVLLLRAQADIFEIWAMRTFACTIWEWLTDAAWPLGYDVAN